jgi:ABC-2 type transport system permease protein
VRNALLIARREFLAHVRTRSFILTVLITPLLMLAAIYFPGLSRAKLPVIPIAVVDEPGDLHQALQRQLEGLARDGSLAIVIAPGQLYASPRQVDLALQSATDALRERQCLAVLHLPVGVLEGAPAELHLLQGAEPPPAGLLETVQVAVTGTLWQARLPGGPPPPALRLHREVADPDPGSPRGRIQLALVFLIMLYVTIFGMSHALLTSVIEEKTSRVVELLLASATSRELMAGKILGLGAVGLALALLWGAAGVTVANLSGRLPAVPGVLLASFLLYFLLGFLLHASMLVGIGAMVNSLKESYHLVAPITLVMVLPALLWWNVTVAPSGALARGLSWFPLTTPMAMLIRVASPAPPPLWEILGTAGVMVVCILGGMRLAARLFDVGMLLRGSTPTVSTIVRLATGRLPVVRVPPRE